MNKLKFLLTLLLITTFNISCKKITPLQKEQQVFYALLPILLDSVYANKGGVLPPPAIKAITAEGEIVYKNLRDTIMPNFYLYNKTMIPSADLRSELFKHFMFADDITITCSNKEYEISKQKINLEATDFKWTFKINPEERKTAVMEFSSLCLDSSLKLGALEANLYCGSKCGRYFIIFIKKVNEKWIVDAIEEIGVS